MRNRVKAIGPVCYATVKAEGAPIVDSGETDVILERAGVLNILYIGRGKIDVATTGGSVTQSILFWHSGTVPEAGYGLDAEMRHMRLTRPKVTCRAREPAVLVHTHISLNSAIDDFCFYFKTCHAHLSTACFVLNFLFSKLAP